MIFFVGNDGTIIKSFPEYVYQGSANTNTIYLIAPFAVNSQVTVAFQLPNGTWTSPVAMTQQQALQNIVNKETGQTYAGWTYALPNNITQNFGVLTVQFFFYSASAGVITATSSAKLTVAKGVPSVLPETPSEDIYESILSNIAALQEQLNNGTFVARSIYAWNSTYTYGANEITFYPSIGDYGAFVQSLQTGNTNHQPYDSDGTLNSTWWKEVVNFNTITEDFFGEIKEQADLATTSAQNAATSEASAAQSASAAASSESAAETAATTATGAAASAEKDAETASTSANAAAASANASAASASQANNSAIAANNSAIAAANSAAQIEDMKTTFALKDESASSLEVSLNNATFVLTMTLKDVNGNTLSTQTVDFPIESMVVGISYNEATKTLIFQLQSGSTIEVPIDDIVDGLATQTALDNVINGTTPVAKATAADTAGQVDNALTVVTDGVSQSYNGSAPLTVKINTTSSTDPESVHFTSQTLNDSQQTQARENIGAASVAEMNAGDDKSYYNLGAYDTYVDNGDGTVTVTRKTRYISTKELCGITWHLNNNNAYPVFYTDGSSSYSISNSVSNSDTISFTKNVWGRENSFCTRCYQDGSVRVDISLSANEASWSVENLLSWIVQNNLYIQAEVGTSEQYTETLIAKTPINTLDKNMSDIVRDEVEKTLNLLDDSEGTLSAQGTAKYFELSPYCEIGKTYTITTYSSVNSSGELRRSDESVVSYTNNNQSGSYSLTFTMVEGYKFNLYLTGAGSWTIMLVEGSTAYPYQPYNGAIVHKKQLNDALEGSIPFVGVVTDINNISIGEYQKPFYGFVNSNTANAPSTSAGTLFTNNHSATYASQQYITDTGAFYFRDKQNGTWNAWKQIATKEDLSKYLPLTGGTINGTINATGQVQEAGQRVYSPNNPQTTIARADNATNATNIIPDEHGAVNPLGRKADYAVGASSTALGNGSFASGDDSTALGSSAYASGVRSMAFGFTANASGLNSVALGGYSDAAALNSTALGKGAMVSSTASDTIQLGDSSLSALRCAVNLTVTSDKRDKTDIEGITDALAFIERLNPVTFVSNERADYISDEDKKGETFRTYGMCEYDRIAHAAGTKKGERRRCGLLAQEVVEAMQSVYGTDNYANIVNDNFHDLSEKPSDVENKYTLAYANLVPFLIGAIKELNAKIKELEGKTDEDN